MWKSRVGGGREGRKSHDAAGSEERFREAAVSEIGAMQAAGAGPPWARKKAGLLLRLCPLRRTPKP